MTEIYNNYIRNTSEYETFVSEVSFINTHNTLISNYIAWVEYIEDNKWKKGIFKMTEELKEIYLKYRTDTKYINKRIKAITISQTNHSYIKVIKDERNPQLEGKTMIFKFGNNTAKIISKYMKDNKLNSIDNTFMIIVSLDIGYPNYNNCHFTSNKNKIEDYNLDIGNEIKFKNLKLSNIERKEKLNKLNEL